MPQHRPLSRRTALQGIAAASTLVASPAIVRAQAKSIKIGILQPVTGALAQDGAQGKLGAEAAIKFINDAGGIKSMGGAKLEMVFGDARSDPAGGTQEVEKMQADGVAAIVGGFASPICLAASQAAARYDLPYLVDVGVSDAIVGRGLKNTFRFGPGFGTVTKAAIENLDKINAAAGKPAKTAMLVHEDGLFGSGLAKLLATELPKLGIEVIGVIAHPTPSRDMSNVALQIKEKNPDLLIPSSYYGEFVLLSRTLQQQKIKPKAIYAVLNGAASNYRFVKEFPEAANFVMDCNHWHDPRKDESKALLKAVTDGGGFWTYNIPLNYSCVKLLADALERAGSTDKVKLTDALRASTFAGHIMPYGATAFGENGQNAGAGPVNTQVQDGDIKVIFPADFANAKPVFPIPA
jgi:branched-chain amino acid transport system substrate-binding protein